MKFLLTALTLTSTLVLANSSTSSDMKKMEPILTQVLENYFVSETDLVPHSWTFKNFYPSQPFSEVVGLQKFYNYVAYASGKINNDNYEIKCQIQIQEKNFPSQIKINCSSKKETLPIPFTPVDPNPGSNEPEYDTTYDYCCNPIKVDSNYCFDSYEEGAAYCEAKKSPSTLDSLYIDSED